MKHTLSFLPRAPRTALAAAFALGLSAACSSSSTGGTEALNQLSSAFCAKATSCQCAGVETSSCSAYVSTVYKLVGFDTSASYTSDSVNQCTGDIKAMACPSDPCTLVIPKSCPGQGQSLPIVAAADAGAGHDAGATGQDAESD